MHLNAKIFKVGVPAVLGVALLYVAGCGISFNATKQGFVPPEVSAEATEKDRALIKADGADTPGRMATLLELGAGIIGSAAAVPVAQAVLAAAEK